ncbi:MAG: hypothetical protein JW837_10985, partial [Sedimentisphaerales bacterium]|nr:hypothetical protein [Sedimentisphaerales bacterium]
DFLRPNCTIVDTDIISQVCRGDLILAQKSGWQTQLNPNKLESSLFAPTPGIRRILWGQSLLRAKSR